MIEISQYTSGLGKACDIYQCSCLLMYTILRHCVTVTNRLFGSRVIDTSHTASLYLHLAPHPPPRGAFCSQAGSEMASGQALFIADETPSSHCFGLSCPVVLYFP